MLVKEVMRRQVATVGPDASVAMAARLMRDEDIGCLPVIERERLIGVITDRDIVVRGVAEGLSPHRAIVREAMSADAIACSVECTVGEARALMAANLIKQLPVLDAGRRVVGLVTLRDITGDVAKCKPHEVTFYKQLVSSSGHPHQVEVGKVYLSPVISKDEVVLAALARFEHDRGLSCWEEGADAYELKEDG